MNANVSRPRKEHSPKLVARLTGLLYLITIATGIFGAGLVQGRFVVDDNPAQTAANVLANESLFRISLTCVLIGTACYVHNKEATD